MSDGHVILQYAWDTCSRVIYWLPSRKSYSSCGEKCNESSIYQTVTLAISLQNYSGPKRHRDKSHRRISVFRATVAEGRKIWEKFDTHDLSRLDTLRYPFSVSVSDRKDDRCGGRLKNSKKKINVIVVLSNGRTMSLKNSNTHLLHTM